MVGVVVLTTATDAAAIAPAAAPARTTEVTKFRVISIAQ
jgi:hypothetical protein